MQPHHRKLKATMPRQVHIRVSWSNDLAYFSRLGKALEMDKTIRDKKLKVEIVRTLHQLTLLMQRAEAKRQESAL